MSVFLPAAPAGSAPHQLAHRAGPFPLTRASQLDLSDWHTCLHSDPETLPALGLAA